MKKEVADIEVYSNFFCYVGYDVDSKEWYIYHLHDSMENNIISFIDRMNSGIAFIGFNNQGYDYPVIHKISMYRDVIDSWTSVKVLQKLKSINDEIIDGKRQYITPRFPILDLFKIHGFDNPAKSCGLKWLEVNMRLSNVEDLPFTPSSIIPEESIDSVINYCKNDVDATYQLYLKSLNKISFRVNMTRKFDHDMMNYSDVKIGEHINLSTYCKLSGVEMNDIKNLKTVRTEFNTNDLIPSYTSFLLPQMQEFFGSIKDVTFYKTKDDEKDSSLDRIIKIGELEIKFAKGGLHSVDKPRSLYPHEHEEGCFLVEKDINKILCPCKKIA